MEYRLPKILLIMAFSSLLACHFEGKSHKAFGTVERERILLSATANEIVSNIAVEEGQPVKKGDLLVQLDDTIAKLQLQEAQATVNQKRAMLTKLQNGARDEDVSAAKAKLLFAKSDLKYRVQNLNRTKALYATNTSAKDTLDKAQAESDSAEAAYRDAREQLLKLTNGSRPEDIMQASAELDAAEAREKLAQYRVDDLHVVATRDGIVESLPWHRGERVSLGSPVAVLLSNGPPFVRVYIPETRRAKLKRGDQVEVQIDGVKRPLAGVINKIALQPSFTPYFGLTASERSRLVYLSEIELPDVSDQIPTGLPAEVILP